VNQMPEMLPSDYLRMAELAISEKNHRSAFDVLQDGCQKLRKRIDAGETGLLAGYVELAIVLSRFVEKDSALKILHGVWIRARNAGAVRPELMVITALCYRHAEESDWREVVRYASALPELVESAHGLDTADPGLTETLRVLGKLAIDAYDQAEYAISSNLGNLVIRLGGDSPEAWRMLGWSRLRQHGGDAAIEAFSKAIELEPGRVGSYRGLAYAYELAGRRADSLAAMDKAVACADRTMADLFSRAQLRLANDDFAGALDDLEAMEIVASDSPPSEPMRAFMPAPGKAEYAYNMPASDMFDFARITRVSVLEQLHRRDEAEQLARSLVANGDRATAATALVLLADSLMRHEPPPVQEAIEYYTRAVNAGVRTAAAYLHRARAHLAAGDVPAALADLEIICERHDPSAAADAAALLLAYGRKLDDVRDAQVSLGHCLLEAGRPAQAIAVLDEVLADQTADWRGLMWRGLARVTVSLADDEAAQAWNEVLPEERTTAALADLIAAVLAAPATDQDVARKHLTWLVERLIFLEDTFPMLMSQKSPARRLLMLAAPEIEEVFRYMSLAWLDRRPGAFQADIDHYLPARETAVRHGFQLIAAKLDILLADNYLRLYELQRALDHIAAARAMLPALGHLPGGVSAERRQQDADKQRTGRMVINFDVEHAGLSALVNLRVLTELSLLEAEATSRAGDPARAVEELGPSVETVAELVAKRFLPPGCGTHLVALLRDAGQTEKALQVLDAISATVEAIEGSRDLDNLRATLHVRRRDLEAAERILGPVAAADRSEGGTGDTPNEVLVNALNLANVALIQHRYQEALDLLDRFQAPPQPRFYTAYGLHVMRGQCHFYLRNYFAAYDELLAAIDMADSLRGKLRDQSQRITWQTGLAKVYELAFLSAGLSFKFSGIFDIMERSRARSYVDQLIRQDLAMPVASELAAAVERSRGRRRLLRTLAAGPSRPELVEIARQLRELGSNMAWAASEGPLLEPDPADVSASLALESAALGTLEQDLDRERLAQQDSVAGPVATYDEIWEFLAAVRRQGKLSGERGQRIILAEYYFAAKMCILFLIAPNIPGPLKIVVEFSRDKVIEFANSAFGMAPGTAGGTDSVFDEATFQSLFSPFVAPIAEHCAPGDLVWIVPHGFLHRVPLHAVAVDGRPLIARNPVIYTPSASVLPLCHARAAARARTTWETAAVLGDAQGDLPYARDEAHEVARLFGVRAHLGRAASGATLRNLLASDPDVVHLACHGRFDQADVGRSGVRLSSDPASPSALDLLSVEELLGLRINTGLVSLSACESGVSDLGAGEELIGLTRAVLHAGSPSVLVSLWPVNDMSTSFLMRDFYKRLRESPATEAGRLARALAGAQVQLMNLTAAQAVDLCSDRLAAVGEPLEKVTAELERANMQIIAGDLQPALACYRESAHSLGQLPGPVAKSLLTEARTAIPLLELKTEAGGNIDYSRRPFSHPYFWAPFILVGDWQ
jgi:CHAT domain-containing protein/tetratricopeptide (TPR) repeat protein